MGNSFPVIDSKYPETVGILSKVLWEKGLDLGRQFLVRLYAHSFVLFSLLLNVFFETSFCWIRMKYWPKGKQLEELQSGYR